jgi:hypothetical protein
VSDKHFDSNVDRIHCYVLLAKLHRGYVENCCSAVYFMNIYRGSWDLLPSSGVAKVFYCVYFS